MLHCWRWLIFKKTFFYAGKRRHCELHDSGSILYFGTDTVPLAIRSSASFKLEILCLAVDRSRSVLGAYQTGGVKAAYSVYGDHSRHESAYPQAFNGEHLDENLRGYHLGRGYRFYDPLLMRFFTADAESPFAQGGINAYAYCTGDPVNRVDPSGRGYTLVDLAHWANSKIQRNVFPAGTKAPFSNLGIDSGFNGYAVEARFKSGDVGPVVERLLPGNFEPLIKRYPGQADAIMINMTERALKRLTGKVTVQSAFVEKRFRQGMTKRDGDMVMYLTDNGIPSQRFAEVRQSLKVGDSQLKEEVIHIFKERLANIRDGKPLIEKDWHAGFWNERYTP
ncbi:RHS repeat-associated core domain-containing protein [Pseudomonas sp. ITEM 17296]|nr:RHS repeat-associated core domain-containing protein [Pseudomonas sp. ITEM 17296]